MPSVMVTRDDCFRSRTRIADTPDVADGDIANLVQEAFEEGAPDRRLTRIVDALGLLLASLSSPRQEARGYAEREASASRTRRDST